MAFDIESTVCGKVTKIMSFGAFVLLENGKSGMVHISEISSGFVRDVHDFLSEGQNVRVKIVKIDEAGKISLSIKQAEPEKGFPAPAEYTKPEASSDFEDMMSRFKTASDDKLRDRNRRAKRREG